jgi:uncharacterized membrane protein
MTLPPIHPAIVHFPIALIIVAFCADIVARVTRRESLRNLGFWCYLVALGTGVLTLIAGYTDMIRLPLSSPAHDYVHLHMYSGIVLAGVLLLLTIWRWRIWRVPMRYASRSFIGVSIILLALTLFQGWYGGEMVYSQGVGVAAADQGPESASKAQERLAAVSHFITGENYNETAIGAPASHESGHGHQKQN